MDYTLVQLRFAKFTDVQDTFQEQKEHISNRLNSHLLTRQCTLGTHTGHIAHISKCSVNS